MSDYEKYMQAMGELACMLLLDAPGISRRPQDIDDTEAWSAHEQKLADAATAIRQTVTGDPVLALTAIRAIRASLDEYTSRHVRRMLADGESWAAIGKVLGVSKQAAQQKYGKNR